MGRGAGEEGLRQVAPALDLVHHLDRDALVGGQQLELGKVEASDVAPTACWGGELAWNAVSVDIRCAGALRPGAEDDEVLDRLGPEHKLK